MRSPIKKELPGGCQTAEAVKTQAQNQSTCFAPKHQHVSRGHIIWPKSEPKPRGYNGDYLSVALDDNGEVYFHPGMLGYWEELFAAANATFLWCPGEPMLVSVSWASETFPSQAEWLQEFASNVRRKIAREKGGLRVESVGK